MERAKAREVLDGLMTTHPELLLDLVEHGACGVHIESIEHGCVYVNRATQHLYGLGFEECLGTGWHRVVHPEDGPRIYLEVEEFRANPQPTIIQFRIRRRDGTIRWIRATVSPSMVDGELTAAWTTITDVTEDRLMRVRLGQQQKLELLGRMTGGIAHDFNNLLTAIISSVEMLRDSPTLPEDDREEVDIIEEAAERAAMVTSRLRNLSHQTLDDDAVVSLNDELATLMPLIKRSAGKGIEVHWTRLEDVTVALDPGLLTQAVLNLVINARAAATDRGLIRITSGASTIGDRTVAVLSVSDDGEGMSPEVAARACDPFFTTRDLGSGLGLSIVHEIVTIRGGDFTIHTAPGKGTTVQLTLPVAADASLAELVPAGVQRGHRILLVERDEALRHAAGHSLTAYGYRISPAAALDEAVELPGPFDALVIDPCDDDEAAKAHIVGLRNAHPNACVVFVQACHGGPGAIGGRNPKEAVLARPYSPRHLLDALDDLLSRT